LKVKITEPGWERYSEYLNGVKFENGESVEELNQMQVDRIAATMRVQVIDGVPENQRLVSENQRKAEVAENMKRVEAEELEAERRREAEKKAEKVKKAAGQMFSREQLEEIADEHGINGLRDVGDRLGVKGRSIEGLIEDILKAQEA
jgi:hypothetical protein